MNTPQTSDEFSEQFGEKLVMRVELIDLVESLHVSPPVLRSEQVGLNPMRSFDHQFRLGDTVRIGDSVGTVNGFSGQRFVSVSCSSGWHNHESLTLVDTANRLYTLAEAIDRIVDGLRMEWRTLTTEHSQCVAGSWLYRLQFDGQGWFYSINKRRYTRCASYEDGQNLCLADYKTRFRADLEMAVKS